MDRKFLSTFGSEWFGISIATLALAEVYILSYGQTGYEPYNVLGEIFMFLGLIFFVAIFILWATRGILVRDSIHGHWENLSRLSFIALIPIIGFVGNSQLINYFGLSDLSAGFSLANYVIDYFLALLLGVLLGYRLYTKEIDTKEINYAIVIPPLAIGTSVFLGSYLAPFYGGSIAHSIYFLTLFGFGIFFFLYIFIGSLALAGHVTHKNHETLATTMLPVGISSLIVINILTIAGFDRIGFFSLSLSTAGMISLILWGFEVWNFMVVSIILITHPTRGSMSVWAYGFPLGLFAVSTLKIMALTNEPGLIWLFGGIVLTLNVVWIYAWFNTYNFMTNPDLKVRRLWENKIE